MRRIRYNPCAKSSQPAYLVVHDMQHQVIEVQRLEPATDLRAAMVAAIKRLRDEGWLHEGSAAYGFVFVQRAGGRRLLMLTPKDTFDATAHSFDPFRSAPAARPGHGED